MEKFFTTKPALGDVESREAGAHPSGRTSEGGSGGAVLREVNGSPRKREHEVPHVYSSGNDKHEPGTPEPHGLSSAKPSSLLLSLFPLLLR